MPADISQQNVISAPCNTRLLVEAGPGYGKTFVACARVAHMVTHGVEPPQILLLSFTRTAVREMRTRISHLAGRGVDVRGVEIRTLDSFAWSLRRGFSQGKTTTTFEENILGALKVLVDKKSTVLQGVREYLEHKKHILVDEAQDLIGARAQLVVTLLNLLPQTSGWTVFLDPAQAIYSWADDGTAQLSSSADFLALQDELKGNVQKKTLSTFYRTADPKLCALLTKARKIVLARQTKDSKHNQISHLLFKEKDGNQRVGGGEIAALIEKSKQNKDSFLVLYRTRFEALNNSAFMAGKLRHRFRFGSLPPVVAPWIAVVINEINKPDFERKDFDAAFVLTKKRNPWLVRDWDADKAWNTLRNLGAKPKSRTKVSSALVADSISSYRLPDELSMRELGTDGPELGTIHGSKGREAEHVLVCLVKDKNDEPTGADNDEEARVLYVAASRAMKSLKIRQGYKPYCSFHEGRVWKKGRDGNLQVELGRHGDVDPLGALLASSEGPREQQKALAAYNGTFTDLFINAREKSTHDPRIWRRCLVPSKYAAVRPVDAYASLSDECVGDLREIARQVWGHNTKTPTFLQFARWVDLTTIAMGKDDPRLEHVPDPWRKTRLWLAPVIVSLVKVYKPFPKDK